VPVSMMYAQLVMQSKEALHNRASRITWVHSTHKGQALTCKLILVADKIADVMSAMVVY